MPPDRGRCVLGRRRQSHASRGGNLLLLLVPVSVTSVRLTAVCLTSLLTTISVLLSGGRHRTKATAHRQSEP